MEQNKKKTTIFSKITNRDDAEKITKEAAIGFFVVAGLQGFVGLLILQQPSLLLDAGLWVVLGLLIWKIHSRVAAALALLLALAALISTLSNTMNPEQGVGGTNIVLAVIIITLAARAMEATWALNSKFKEHSTESPVNEIPAP